MPRLDKIHVIVRNALEKDGWSITHDPFIIQYEEQTVYADLGAEKLFAAERQGKKIAVEVKSFIHASKIHDLELALGQYNLYQTYLELIEPDRHLYLAVNSDIYEQVFGQKAIQVVIEKFQLAVVVVNLADEEVVTWIR